MTGLSPIVVLDGYYGVGNLGDDILMLVSYSILREAFDPAEICVRVVGDHTYVRRLLTEDCVVMPVERFAHETSIPRSTKLSVLGGGGFLADHFGTKSVFARTRQRFLRTFGVGALKNLDELAGIRPLVRRLWRPGGFP